MPLFTFIVLGMAIDLMIMMEVNRSNESLYWCVFHIYLSRLYISGYPRMHWVMV